MIHFAFYNCGDLHETLKFIHKGIELISTTIIFLIIPLLKEIDKAVERSIVLSSFK